MARADEVFRLGRIVAKRCDERDEAQAVARYLLALTNFPSAAERLAFIDAHPWLQEPCHVCDADSRCPEHQEVPMSYPRDLDEIEEQELRDELSRRESLRANGLCDYCARPSSEPTCKFPERHRPPQEPSGSRNTNCFCLTPWDAR